MAGLSLRCDPLLRVLPGECGYQWIDDVHILSAEPVVVPDLVCQGFGPPNPVEELRPRPSHKEVHKAILGGVYPTRG